MDLESIFGNALRSALGPTAAAYALVAIGLNLHYGYTGLMNFGIVGYMLVGAYGLGISVTTLGLPFGVGILVGLGASVLLSLLLGLPTLRLRADYFAIVTIAVAEILRLLARSSPLDSITGSVFGLQSVAGWFYDVNPIDEGRYGWGVLSYPHTQLWALIVAWILAVLCAVLVALLVRSPWGRVVKSIREDEDAARSLGKNTFGVKMQSLVIGGLFASLGGIMFAINTTGVNADAYRPQVTFFAYTILILGGTATKWGPIVGSMIFWFLFSGIQALVREAANADLLPEFLSQAGSEGAIAIATVGLGLILLMIFRPEGIFGNREEMRLDA